MTRRVSNPKFESQIRNSCRSTIGTLFTLGGVERDDVVTLKKKKGVGVTHKGYDRSNLGARTGRAEK